MQFKPLPIKKISSIIAGKKNCILLDTARFSEKNHESYLFFDPKKILIAKTFDEIEPLLKDLDRYTKKNWVSGYISYEASYVLEKRFHKYQKKTVKGLPLAWFGVFKEPVVFNHFKGSWNRGFDEIEDENHDLLLKNDIGTMHHIEQSEFSEKINAIRSEIRAGNTYQVNFTYDVSVKSAMNAFELYAYLRRNQQTPYCSFIKSDYGIVSSFSPELFFNIDKRRITVKPMKGTTSRGYSANEDKKQKVFLENDMKNRAENLMIVDLLRNDLGRVCKTGTVITEKLFEVETHPTVHQMTSTINGQLRDDCTFETLFKNIFPCGSVTGAPKIKTMEIINRLEVGNRGVYCGAIGYISSAGDACFNVPIRTLQKTHSEKDWRYRVGSGIIWDSMAEDEWHECKHKCSFLLLDLPEFKILESLLFDKGLTYTEDHMERMKESCVYFNYPFDNESFGDIIDRVESELDLGKKYKVRILLDSLGVLNFDSQEINSKKQTSDKLLFSSQPIDETNRYLFHKTTYRPWYKKAYEDMSAKKSYDTAFINSKNEITEGARSNIFIKQNGTLYTPPVSCGLLGGILRKNLLTKGACHEKTLYRNDLLNAEEVYCGNSVRGLIRVFPSDLDLKNI